MRNDDDIARIGAIEGDDAWTLTSAGKHVTFLKPDPDTITLADITKHTSQICRFTGATSQYYSVAQHSILVGRVVKDTLDFEGVDWGVEYWDQILAALLHDAEETYTQDISGPLKSLIGSRYRKIADGLSRTIHDKFDVDYGYHNQTVKDADNVAILIERYYLMPDSPDWPKIEKRDMTYSKPVQMGPETARITFLKALKSALVMRDALKSEA